MRRKEQFHSAFGIQRAEWKREWRFGGILSTSVFGRVLLWRRLRLPLTLEPLTLAAPDDGGHRPSVLARPLAPIVPNLPHWGQQIMDGLIK